MADAGTFDPRWLAGLHGLEWRARYVMEGFLAGLHGSPFHGTSVEFRDYRDYQPGDDLRHLDWRLYARSDRLYVKRHQQETSAHCYVLCDTSASMAYRGDAAWGSKLDCARALSLALAWLLLRQNDAVGLVALTPGGDGPVRFVRPSHNPLQLGLLIRELGALAPQGGPVLSDLVAHAARVAHRRSLVVLVTDLLEAADSLREGLEALHFDGHDCACVQVLDGDEVDFPFMGTLVFEDPESGLRRRVDAARAREGYRERLDAFMEEHRRRFRQLEIVHGLVRTDEEPGRALARVIAGREALAAAR
jgi:uncharacterized protein (DUF58 family)